MSLMTKTDLVAKFNRIQNGLDEDNSINSKTNHWIDKLETCVIQFMKKIFHKSIQNSEEEEKVNNALPPHNVNHLLKISDTMSTLVLNMVTRLQPLLADLLFMNNQDLSKIKNKEPLKIVKEFERNILVLGNGGVTLDKRINKLITFVENLKKFSEYLLQESGTDVLGKSPLQFLQDLHEGSNIRKFQLAATK